MKYFKNYKDYIVEKSNNDNNKSINESAISTEKDFGFKPAPKATAIDLKDSGLKKDQWEILRSTFTYTDTVANRKATINLENAIKKGEGPKPTPKDKEIYKVALKLLKTKFNIDRKADKDKSDIDQDKKATKTLKTPAAAAPSQEPTSSEKTNKDKTLKKGEPTKSEVFQNDVDMSDKEFEALNKGNINKNVKPFKFKPNPGMTNPKYPKKYTKIIERMMNTNRNGTGKFGWSNFSKSTGGAGDISAQGGELLALMGTSMDDKSAKDFYEQMRLHVKEVKAKGLKPTIDESWVDASEKQRAAILKRIAVQYPKGTKIMATSWDTESEVTALGLTDYKKNKGFSTDIYLKVKTPDGKEILDEVSLKKSLVINLLNSGTGQFKKWDPKLGDDINQNVYAKKQQSRNNEFFMKNKAAIIKISKTDKRLAEVIASKKVKIEDMFTAEKISSITKKKIDARAYNNIVYKSIEALSTSGNKSATKIVDDTNKSHDEFVSKSYNAVATNKKLKSGMLEDIRNEFPLKSISEGEESMALGEHSLDKMTLKSIFGTDDFNQIKDNLSVKTDKKSGKSFLAYEAVKGKDTIPIADISIYEDGKGYGGVFKFSLVLNRDFAKKIKEANGKVYSGVKESFYPSYGEFLFEKYN
jgi:hypothetical protein